MKKYIAVLFFLIFTFCSASELVDLNTASLEELDRIEGVGPATAEKIINARPFSSVDDLLKVKGIGEKTLQNIKTQGIACVNCQQTQVQDAVSKSAVKINYPDNIYFSELMPSPKGTDETEEWIKIYNANDFDVNLSGWTIEDEIGAPTVYKINTGAIIFANQYLIFKRPDTKIILNNEGDSLILRSPDDKIKDNVIFEKAPIGQTYIKTSSGWQWSGALVEKEVLPKKEKSDISNEVGSNVAAVSQFSNQDYSNYANPWFLFLTAVIIAVVSAILFIFIKLKIKIN
jgi:competence ComEA-like helix-hairpin-helix protein